MVAILVLVMRKPAAIDHCRSCLVFLIGSFSDFYLVRVESLDPEWTRDLTSRVLDCMYLLPAGINSLTRIIGLKYTCFSFLFDLVCLSLLVGFIRVFNMGASCNNLSKLL